MKVKDKFIDGLIGFGALFVILGFALGTVIFYNYYKWHSGTVQFDSKSSFEDLGAVLSGTAGLMFTIAGVIFFTYTLYQTRVEMRQTQNILSTQLAENTFFNLIKHHRETYSMDNSFAKSNEFSEELQNLLDRTSAYNKQVADRTFDNFSSMTEKPIVIYHSTIIVQKVGDSLIHIVKFIDKALTKENEFYHATLYNNLSNEERILVGYLLVHNSLHRIEIPKFGYDIDYLATETWHTIQDVDIAPIIGTVKSLKGKTFNIPVWGNSPEARDIIKEETKFHLQSVDEIMPATAISYELTYYPDTKSQKKISSKYLTEKGQQDFSLLTLFLDSIFEFFKETNYVKIDLQFIFGEGPNAFKVLYGELDLSMSKVMIIDRKKIKEGKPGEASRQEYCLTLGGSDRPLYTRL